MDTHARRLIRPWAGLVVTGVLAVAGLVLCAGPVTADPTPLPLPTLGPAGPTPPGDSNVAIPTPTPNPPRTPPVSVSAVPTNLYTPGPTAPPPGSQPNTPAGTEDDPAWYDIPGQIRVAINELLIWIATSSLDTVLGALTSTVMGSPDLINNTKVRAITDTTLVIANALLVLFVVVGGYLLTVRGTLQTQYGPQDILIRLALGGIGANLAIVVCGNIVWIANAITAAIGGQGITGAATAEALKATISNAAGGNTFLLALLILALLVMAVVVVAMFILRIAFLVLLIGVAPLALVCHATPITEGLAFLWWRALGACLGIQLAQAIILLATLRVFLTPDGPSSLGLGGAFLSIVICLTMMWILIKLPGWMRYFVLGPLGQRRGRGLLGAALVTYMGFKVITAGWRSGWHSGQRGSRAGGDSTDPGTGTGAGTNPRLTGPSPSRPRTTPPAGGAARPSPGRAAPVRFSAAVPATPLPAGTTGRARLSTAPSPQPPTVPPPPAAGPVTFSHHPQPPTPARPAAPAPAPRLSHPTPPHQPLPPTATTGPTAARRPSAASPPPARINSASPQASPAPPGPAARRAIFSSAPTVTGPASTPATIRSGPASTRATIRSGTPGTGRQPATGRPAPSPSATPPVRISTRATGTARSGSPSPGGDRTAAPAPRPAPPTGTPPPAVSPSPRRAQARPRPVPAPAAASVRPRPDDDPGRPEQKGTRR